MVRTRAAAERMEWAALPSELLQSIAALLHGKDRENLLRTCSAWCAAIEAAPELWPVTVLSFENGEEEEVRAVFQAARQFDRHTWRVRLEQPNKKRHWGRKVHQQPYLVPSLLLQLRTSVRRVDVAMPCAGAALAAAQHLRHLYRLNLIGNAAEVDWSDRRGTHALRALGALRLVCQRRMMWEERKEGDHVPVGMERLRAATQLSSLRLSCKWSDRCADTLPRLPALHHLRLDVMQCGPRNAAQAVTTLHSLTGLTALALAVHACRLTDDAMLGERIAGWKNWAPLPAFGPLAALLTQLRLVGAVSLPPDWRQLTSLRRLRVENEARWAAGDRPVRRGWGCFDWGTGSLSALTALTQLRVSGEGVLPDAEMLATVPNLVEVAAWDSSLDWQAAVQRALPGVHVNCTVHCCPEKSPGSAGGSSQDMRSSSDHSTSSSDELSSSEEESSSSTERDAYPTDYYYGSSEEEQEQGEEEEDSE